VCLCGAERLTPPLRRRIETGFNAVVRDFYGCHECNLVAWECPESGLLHTSDDSVIVEVLRDGRPAPKARPARS
jgi:phenylacetate-coenzyme A ligase PaaK-like adenylate-forming protein